MSLRSLLFSGAYTYSGCYLSPGPLKTINIVDIVVATNSVPVDIDVLVQRFVLLPSRSRWRSRRRYQDFRIVGVVVNLGLSLLPIVLHVAKPASSLSLLPEIVLSLRYRQSSDPLISGITAAIRAVHGAWLYLSN
jgi:hypothetical protein